MSRTHSTLQIILALLAIITFGNATTYYVDVNGNNGNGLTWSNAKTTLQGAISASSPGDDILVKYGNYSVGTAISILSNRRISSDDGTNSTFDTANPDSSLCIFQGDATSRIIYFYGSSITNNCRLRGLKITGGNATTESVWAGSGGGVLARGGANPIIENCWITANYGGTIFHPGSGSVGGGIMLDDVTSSILMNNNISNNTASTDEYYGGSGGGVYISGTASVAGNSFTGNIATRSTGSQWYANGGGAIYHRDGTLTLLRNLFYSNSAVYRTTTYDRAEWGPMAGPGGVDLGNASSAIIKNNIFRSNLSLNSPNSSSYSGQDAAVSAGALRTNGNAVVENNTFWGNEGKSVYAYMATASVGAATFNTNDVVRNNIFVDNDSYSAAAIKTYGSNILISHNSFYDQSVNYPDGTISLNEVLIDPQFVNGAGGDFALLETSPCIDAGAADTDTTGFCTDYSGGYRISRGVVDIGAFEYQFPLPVDSIPSFNSADTAYATEDQTFDYQILATDPRDLELTFGVGWMPHWLSFDADSLFGVPLEGDLDTSFQVIAANGIASDTLVVTLLVTAVNAPPVMSEIPNQTMMMNGSISGISFTLSDEETDADDLFLDLQSSNTTLLPAEGIVVGGSNGAYDLSLIPAQDQSGVTQVTLTASDGENVTPTSFNLLVEPPNSPPEISPEPGLSAIEDILYKYAFNLSDPDGDLITLETQLPSWLSYSLSSDNIINTIAGIGYAPHNGDYRTAVSASLQYPAGVCYMNDGSLLIADKYSYRIRKIGLDGNISTIAGTGSYTSSGDGGLAVNAGLNHPNYVVSDNSGNVYIGEDDGSKIRMIDTNGYISTIAGNGSFGHSGDGGPATAAAIAGGGAICVDQIGNIYFTEPGYGKVRKIDTQGIISTIAGNGDGGTLGDGGPAIDASFSYPYGIAMDPQGNLYVSDANNYRIRMIGIDSVVSTIAGTGQPGFSGDGGPATSAKIGGPRGLAVDGSQNVYFTDASNHRIRKINSLGIITTFAGSAPIIPDEDPQGDFYGDGGPADSAALYEPMDVAISNTGHLAIADTENKRVREVSLPVHQITGTPGDDHLGPNAVRLIASDGEDDTLLDFVIEVQNVNDPPRITSNSLINTTEDQAMVYHGIAEDVDSQSLVWQFQNLPLWLTAHADSVFGMPLHGDSDTSFVAVVSDGEFNDTLEVMVALTEVNDTPVILSPTLVQAVEDVQFEYVVRAADEENDALSIQVDQLANWLSARNDTISGIPSEGVMDTTFIVIVSDGNSADTLEVAVDVASVNDPPFIAYPLNDIHIDEDAGASVILTHLETRFLDVDFGDHLDFQVEALDVGLDSLILHRGLEADSVWVIAYPTTDFFGTVNIAVTATDDSLASISDTLLLTIIAVNDAPVFTVIPEQSFNEDESLTITLESLFPYISDVDDGDRSLSWDFQGTDHIEVAIGDASLMFTAESDWFGSEQIGVRVADAGGLMDSSFILINVLPINDAPMITAIPDTGFFEDGELQIPLPDLFEYVSDNEDADTVLVWSYAGFEHITATTSDEILILTSQMNWYGTETLQVIVTDSESLADTADVTFHVSPVNDAPQTFSLVSPIDELEINSVDSTELTFSWEEALDVDGDTLQYVLLLNTVEWDTMIGSIDTTYHRLNIEGLPRSEDISWTCLALDASDSTSATDIRTFQVSSSVDLAADGILPEHFILEPNFPNPFNPATTIRYGLPEVSDLSIVIYDVRGRMIKSWIIESQAAGWHELIWQGRDQSGQSVATGLYLARLQVVNGSYSKVIKMLYLR